MSSPTLISTPFLRSREEILQELKRFSILLYARLDNKPIPRFILYEFLARRCEPHEIEGFLLEAHTNKILGFAPCL